MKGFKNLQKTASTFPGILNGVWEISFYIVAYLGGIKLARITIKTITQTHAPTKPTIKTCKWKKKLCSWWEGKGIKLGERRKIRNIYKLTPTTLEQKRKYTFYIICQKSNVFITVKYSIVSTGQKLSENMKVSIIKMVFHGLLCFAFHAYPPLNFLKQWFTSMFTKKKNL